MFIVMGLLQNEGKLWKVFKSKYFRCFEAEFTMLCLINSTKGLFFR